MTDEERCAEARKFQRIDDAFRRGDLEGLRAALDDPALVPNGQMPDVVGSCLVYAIYYSPLAFIRVLLEMGADPNAPADDGFPPLIAALSCTREGPGFNRRADVDEILRLLLAFGADPNQRGINDYTALHMAVAERNARAVRILLDGGADPSLETRIDDYETPLAMAKAAGLTEIAAMLAEGKEPGGRRLRAGLTLLAEARGWGDVVRRHERYRVRLRLWLNRGEAVRWQTPSGPVGAASLDEGGEVLITEVRVDRGALINGLYYGVQGMRVGGMRRLAIAPHLAYGSRGVPGVIPPGAKLTAEIEISAGPLKK